MQPQQTPPRIARRSGFTIPSELKELLDLDTPSTVVRAQPVAVQAPQPAPIAAPVLVERPARPLFRPRSQSEGSGRGSTQRRARAVRPDWTSVIETPKTKTQGDIGQAALDNMIQQAQKRYVPHGTRVEISCHHALKAIGFDQWSHTYSRRPDKDQSAPVNLDKLHAYLEAAYGGEAGETTAFKQQAKVLIDFFPFDTPDSMAATARYVGCTVRMWATKRDYGPNAGLYELDYRRREDLQKSFNAIATAFAWVEQYDLSLDPRREQLTGYDFYFKSRYRESFRGLACTLYSEKWEFQFSHDAAAALKLFLGQHGA